MDIYETIPQMQARYAIRIADLQIQVRDLQAQIERLTTDLEMERRARERAEADRARYFGALWEIKHHEGRVCALYPFDECRHDACESSHRAWVIADKALAGQATTP